MNRHASILLAGMLVLSTNKALAETLKLDPMPVSVESNDKMLMLNEAGIKTVYPSALGRPNKVFVTPDHKVSVAFEWRNSQLAPNEVNKLSRQFPAVIRSQVPDLKSLKSGTTRVGGTSWARFIFTTSSTIPTEEMRSEMMVTSAGGRMLVVTIAGTAKDYAANQTVVRGLVSSIKVN